MRPRGRPRHPRLQRPARGGRAGAAPRPDHRGPWRRQSRRTFWGFNEEAVVRAGRRQRDPADLGCRPRDRHHADRPCRRLACADTHGRCRTCRAGAHGPADMGAPARRHPDPRDDAGAGQPTPAPRRPVAVVAATRGLAGRCAPAARPRRRGSFARAAPPHGACPQPPRRRCIQARPRPRPRRRAQTPRARPIRGPAQSAGASRPYPAGPP